jgi:molybdopterin-containing oxidoreductase family iron-sulfur binding subunit
VAFGSPRRVRPSLKEANIIVCLDADPLATHPAATRLALEWADNRRIDAANPAHQKLSRMYAVEGVLSVTGMMADERIIARSSVVAGVAAAIADHLGLSGGPKASLDAKSAEILKVMLKDLDENHGRSIVMAGEGQPAHVHAMVAAINEALGNVGTTVTYAADSESNRMAALTTLTRSMASGGVDTLVILGGNPVYDAPTDLSFASALGRVGRTVHLSLYRNETSHACSWSLPRTHWLEAWGDVAAYDGTKSITQPTIMPMILEAQRGWSPLELVAVLCGSEPSDGYSIVRASEMARSRTTGATFEAHWRTVLDKGVVADTAAAAVSSPVNHAAIATAVAAAPKSVDGLELVMHTDSAVYDGRYANLGWLQELPNAITKVTWDNAACMSPALMEQRGLRIGDVVLLNTGSGSLKAAVFPVPGMDPSTVSLTLGWGRGAEAGRVADGAGFNAYTLRTTGAPDVASISVANTGERYDFAHTQDHGAVDALIPDVPLGNASGGVQGRLPTIVRSTDLDTYQHHPDFAKHAVHVAHRLSLWEETNLDGGQFRWAMSIDLNTCTGCSACVVACQAENNIPIVGKDQVARGRELHWLRIDRYFKGDDPARPEAVFVQPVACMQCENAPCEQVCPVAATLHDKDGLNVMVYNRCIGTRYCSNNCPYKVRRFNWFDYWRREPVREQEGIFAVKPGYYTSSGPDEWRRMQLNPEVTVRMRGVMEKCSFCTQRIAAARIDFKNEWVREGGTKNSPNFSIPDGAIQTACQQACATNAIVFGDLNDPKSEVSRLQKQTISYGLLEELNTKPRLKYLAKVRNPGVSSEASDHASTAHAKGRPA